MFGQRQGIIVYIHSLKHVKSLRKLGNIHYVSKRLKYVVLYLNIEEVEGVTARLNKLNYVKKVDVSYKPFVNTEFENGKEENYQEELAYSVV